jgi:16S rRNA G966 N2-methylase RsmD
MTLGMEIRTVLETRQTLVFSDPPYPAGNPGEIAVAQAKKMAQFEHLKKTWTKRIYEIKKDSDAKDSSKGQIEICQAGK